MIKLPASLQLWLASLNPFTVALYKRFYITWLYFFHTSCTPFNPSKLVFSVLVTQLCPTLCNPMDCSLPGSSVQEIFQARILECVAISFSRGSSQPRNQTQVSCIAGRFFTLWATEEAPLAPPKKDMCVCVYNIHIYVYIYIGQCNLFTWLLQFKDVSCYKIYIAKQTPFIL